MTKQEEAWINVNEDVAIYTPFNLCDESDVKCVMKILKQKGIEAKMEKPLIEVPVVSFYPRYPIFYSIYIKNKDFKKFEKLMKKLSDISSETLDIYRERCKKNLKKII